MNEVFIIGTIKTQIDFKFILNSKKHFSKVKFKVQTIDRQELEVIGYNNISDFALINLKKENKIFIYGILNTNMEIEVKRLTYII